MKKTVYIVLNTWNNYKEYVAVKGSYQEAREALVEYLQDPNEGFGYDQWESFAEGEGFLTVESFQEHVVLYPDWDLQLGVEIVEEEIIF